MAMRRALPALARNSGSTTHFGFRDVPLSAKQGLVGQVFASVASRYDVMNDLMSAGAHRAWKASFVRALSPTDGLRVLDCAGGTGDVAFRILDRAPGADVTVCDISGEMLDVGRKRAERMGGPQGGIRFVEGNAEKLPFDDASFDAYTISFGMRNVPRPDVAVAEAMRVLRPGGRFMMLEFAGVENPAVKMAYDAYSFQVIPVIGQAVAGDRESYQYLVESIRKFPKQQEFLAIMRAAGMRRASCADYSFGIAACYSGFKPAVARTAGRTTMVAALSEAEPTKV